MKYLLFDSGPLINLSMNGLLYVLEEMKKNFDGKFIITRQVKYEIIDRPMHVERFEFGAIQLESLLESGVLELPEAIGIDDKELSIETQEIMNKANHCIKVRGQWISLVSAGEMSCLALADMLKKQGHETMIAIDERTTRVLGENPEELEQLMSERLHQRAELVQKDLSEFSKHRFIRTSELVYVAYKKGLIHNLNDKRALEAVLYATKFKGTAISYEEIDQLKKM